MNCNRGYRPVETFYLAIRAFGTSTSGPVVKWFKTSGFVSDKLASPSEPHVGKWWIPSERFYWSEFGLSHRAVVYLSYRQSAGLLKSLPGRLSRGVHTNKIMNFIMILANCHPSPGHWHFAILSCLQWRLNVACPIWQSSAINTRG